MISGSPIICPTITATTPEEYNSQINNVRPFAQRIHLDLAKYPFSPRNLLDVSYVSWPADLIVDIHLMINSPYSELKQLINLRPHLVILHAEASGNFVKIADMLHSYGIQVGVALLGRTAPAILEDVLALIDHVLIFSGNLGYQGGSMANLKLLYKVVWLRQRKPELEIGWDGGINDVNAKRLVNSGINVLNVGGFIQKSGNPQRAYATIKRALR